MEPFRAAATRTPQQKLSDRHNESLALSEGGSYRLLTNTTTYCSKEQKVFAYDSSVPEIVKLAGRRVRLRSVPRSAGRLPRNRRSLLHRGRRPRRRRLWWLTCASQGRKDFRENTDIIFNMFTIDGDQDHRSGALIRGAISATVGTGSILSSFSLAGSRTCRASNGRAADLSCAQATRTLSAILRCGPSSHPLSPRCPPCSPVTFMLFLFTVFGVMGMILFGGTLEGRCHAFDPQGGQLRDERSAFAPFTLDEANGRRAASRA